MNFINSSLRKLSRFIQIDSFVDREISKKYLLRENIFFFDKEMPRYMAHPRNSSSYFSNYIENTVCSNNERKWRDAIMRISIFWLFVAPSAEVGGGILIACYIVGCFREEAFIMIAAGSNFRAKFSPNYFSYSRFLFRDNTGI